MRHSLCNTTYYEVARRQTPLDSSGWNIELFTHMQFTCARVVRWYWYHVHPHNTGWYHGMPLALPCASASATTILNCVLIELIIHLDTENNPKDIFCLGYTPFRGRPQQRFPPRAAKNALGSIIRGGTALSCYVP